MPNRKVRFSIRAGGRGGIYGGSSSPYIYRLVKVREHFLGGGVSRIGSFYLRHVPCVEEYPGCKR